MNNSQLKKVVFDQKEAFNKKQNLIYRDVHLDKFIKSELAVIISGIRRCGKSSLLYLIKEKMKLEEADYCYFNFDDERIIPNVTTILDDVFNIHIELYGNQYQV